MIVDPTMTLDRPSMSIEIGFLLAVGCEIAKRLEALEAKISRGSRNAGVRLSYLVAYAP